MKKYTCLIVLFFVCFINTTYALSSCEENVTRLTVNKKNDFRLISKSCDFEDNPFIENFLSDGKQKILINKYSMDGGKWPQKLEAVSIYKKKNKVGNCIKTTR